jgi:hypothetical protein
MLGEFMAVRIQLRRDTSQNWTLNNPILASGEIGFETDANKFKVGDGVKDWSTLSYASAESSGPHPFLLMGV